MSEYLVPDFTQSASLPACLAALPAKASLKGMFFDYLWDTARSRGVQDAVAARTGLKPKKHTGFMEYPAAEYLQIVAALAAELHPNAPEKEGMRRVGQGIYPFFVTTMIGKVLFGVLGKNPDRIFPIGAKGWQVTTNFGEVKSEVLGAKHARYHFAGMPMLLDSYTYGVIEGAFTAIDAEGALKVQVKDLSTCVFDLQWK